ncbi:MAG: hypothetical protein ACXAD7_15915 [Candidatus Kariarchaeaceae archaeon]|jgi:hypothetical protein
MESGIKSITQKAKSLKLRRVYAMYIVVNILPLTFKEFERIFGINTMRLSNMDPSRDVRAVNDIK